MNKITRFCLMGILALSLIACNLLTPKRAATPTTEPTEIVEPTETTAVEPTQEPTETAEPTETLEAAVTDTAEPKPISTPEAAASNTPAAKVTDTPITGLTLPKSTPVKAWKDIPIMPGAIAGDENSGTYTFTIKATTAEIGKYYDTELTKLGYNLLTSSSGNTKTAIRMYMKTDASATPTLTIIVQDDGTCLVVLI